MGESWMEGRFGHFNGSGAYRAEWMLHPPGKIEDYVDQVALIGITPESDKEYDVAPRDLSTPIGDDLPADLEPAQAAELAKRLGAALPRAQELLTLLERRARQEEQAYRRERWPGSHSERP
jgi:hypothetical protein